MAETPNLFILLDLNPNDNWDEVKFKQAVRNKRIEWSRERNFPGAKGLEAKRKLELLPKMIELAADPEQRKAQATAARSAQAAGQKARVEEFEKQLKFYNAREYIEQTDFEKFVADFKDVYSQQEIVKRIKVEIRPTTNQNTTTTQTIETSTLKTINEKLKSLDVGDLYELLGMAKTTDNQKLCDAADLLHDEMMRRQPKTAEVTLKGELAGLAKSIFKSAEKRKEYDENLKLASLNSILKELEVIVNRQTEKEVHVRQIELFLESTRKAGWKDELALAKLKEFARQRKWFLQTPTTDATIQLHRCGYCGETNEKGRNFCRNCQRELTAKCPKCAQNVFSDDVTCGNCGFPIGNRYLVDDLLAQCQHLLGTRDLQRAQEVLKEIEQTWPLNKPEEARVQKIRAYKAEIQRQVQAQQQTAEQLRQLMDQRQYFAARQFLATHADALPDRSAYQRTIDASITQAQEFLRQAQATGISREDKIELCRRALRTCADYKDARDLLSTTPPSPPRNLQAKMGGTIVSLTWELSPTRGVNYKVIRKARSQPVSTKDGTLLETVTGQLYDDTRPEVGIPLYYAVFAECEGIISLQGATLSQPVMLIQDVSNETVSVDDHQVSISWKVPPNTTQVVVMRKEGTTSYSPKDAIQVPLVDPSHLVDQNVENDQDYLYAIYCQFKDHEGKVRTSPGKVISARPETPPSPITKMQISHSQVGRGYQVQLQWIPPTKGEVVVIRSKQQPLPVGRVVPKSQLAQYGAVLTGNRSSVTDTWTQSGIEYYTPIVLLQDSAYVGTCQRYICTEDIQDLKSSNLGSALRLQWTWPANCQEVLVSYSTQDWPEPGSPATTTRKVTRAEYEHMGHFDLKGTLSERDCYVVVAAVVKQGNDQIITPGARRQVHLGSKIVVTYEIKNPTLLRKKRTLHLIARTPGFLPSFVLISKRDRLPFKKADGETFYRIGETPIEREVVIDLPDKTFPPRTFGKLFLEDDQWYDMVNINHPSEDKLRLS